MEVLRMIDALNANNNVAYVGIRVSSNIKWNNEIVELIMNRCSNLYSIGVDDYSNQVDDRTHKIIKQLTQQ